MPIPYHRSLKKRIFTSSLTYDIPITVGATVAAIAGASKLWKDERISAYWLIAAAVVVFVSTISKHIAKHVTEEEKHSIHPLEGCLETLRAVLLGDDVDENIELRLCIHRIEKKELVQLTEYCGTNCSNKVGRRISVRAGITGKAIRTGQFQVSNRKEVDQRAHLDDMVKNFGFSRSEAERMKPDRESWAAMPIGDPVEAVLFLDTRSRGFFGNSNSNRRKAIMSASMGIAEFTRRRYR
ncbi:hypothetical protein CA54_16620 [Symmachiella macrocystis]|uniref:Uncharacterized protein n=1 Tax=Symmachiella macrocystis TaxID=2527985 RepID=A0A5C6BNF2_9PLAN|nr:hypothetical protein [Symmachiella macrocystis]TWU12836.1 hypothetical protein CA54_16620 [Symmachiella macrocystis]